MNKKITIELGKATIIFGLILFAFGYFVGSSLPITGSYVADIGSGVIVADRGSPSNNVGNQVGSDASIKLSPDDDPTLGDLKAPVQVYEFSDFQCPFCSRFFSDSVKQLEKEYISTGKVLFVYKDFPLQQIHPAAIPAAIYSNCANEQGKWKEFHDAVFENQNVLTQGDDGLKQLAQQAGLDMNKLNSCTSDDSKQRKEIQKDLAEGSSIGVTGTPAIFIGNNEKGFTRIVGAQPYSVVKQAVEKYL